MNVNAANSVDVVNGSMARVQLANFSPYKVCLKKDFVIGTAHLLDGSSNVNLVSHKTFMENEEKECVYNCDNSEMIIMSEEEAQDVKLLENPPAYYDGITKVEMFSLLWKSLGFETDQSALTQSQKRTVCRIFMNHRPALQLHEDDTGNFTRFQVKLDTDPDVKPTRAKLRPIAPHLKDVVEKQIQKWLRQDVIEEIQYSPWTSAIVVVEKKSDRLQKKSFRVCIDFRPLNQALKQGQSDSRPIALMGEKLAQLKNIQSLAPYVLFSTFDFVTAYESLWIAEEDRHKTAFITHKGLYAFKRLCFGLASAPS